MPPFYNDDENASDILGVVVGMVGGGSLAGTGAAAAGAAAAVVAAEDEESVDAAGEEKTEPSLAAIGPSGRFVRRPPPEHHRPQHHNEGQRLDENRREGDHDDDDGGGVSGRDEGCETDHGARSRSEGRIPGSGGPRLRDRWPGGGGGGDSRSDEEDACAVAEPLESANRCRAEPADARTAAESMTEAATAAPPTTPTTTPPQRSYINSRGDLPLWSHGRLYGAETTVPLPMNSRRRGRLTTIPERKVCIPERRVTFASAISENTTPTTNLAARKGATMVDDTNNKNHHDHDAREREILLEQTATIPHVSEYTPRDKRKMWYTKKEMSSMRLRCVRSVLVLSRYRELYCPSFFRGLETLVQELVAQHRGDDDDACGGESFPVSATERRRWGGVSAVLIEQRRQRYRCLETHGVVYAGMASPEQVRRAYAAQGRTSESSSIARGLALLDEADAREWLLEQSTGDENDARHWYRESPDPNDSGKPKRYASIDHRHCDNYYETDETDHRCFRNGHGDDESHLPRGLRWALETLLGSFLELRIGDVYLGMGEQFF